MLPDTEDTRLVGPQIHYRDIPSPRQRAVIQKLTVTRSLQSRFAVRWTLNVDGNRARTTAELWWNGHWNEIWTLVDLEVVSATACGTSAKHESWDAAIDELTPYVTTVLGLRGDI